MAGVHHGPLRRWWPIAAVLLLLGLAVVTTAHSAPRLTRVDAPADDNDRARQVSQPPPERVEPSLAPGEAADPPLVRTPGWMTAAVEALCLVTVLGILLLLLWMVLRDRLRQRVAELPDDEGRPGSRTAEQVVAALDAGLVDLSDADVDPRRAVIACWLRLEEAAAAAGTPRQPGDTPTDLVTRLLRAHGAGGKVAGGRPGVSADVLARFADVYREARYATHTVDEAMRAQARSALQRLRGELTAGAAP